MLLQPPIIDVLAKAIEYDPESGELTWRPSRRHRGGQSACVPDGDGGLLVRLAGQALDAGLVAWALAKGVIPDAIERVNGDPTDNRLDNLRPRMARRCRRAATEEGAGAVVALGVSNVARDAAEAR